MKQFKFKLGNDVHEWDREFITYEELAAVPPGLPPGSDLFLKEKGKPGRLLKAGDRFDLAETGIEKFYIEDTKAGAGAK